MTSPILATQKWLKDVVIDHNFCPFANKPFRANAIRFEVVKGNRMETCLEQLILACEELDVNPTISTTLLILSEGFENFEAYLDLVETAEALLEMQNYEGVYQIASFHPEYCFADAEMDDAANSTNRSPFPMLHILREAEVEDAIESYPEVESIPNKNIALTRAKGLAYFQALRLACLQ